ncbi:MAG: bifunctional protein-serine/threonine kinase/phosphatase [Pseudomonadota bacterium]
MPLQVEIGHASFAGVRERNEDFFGIVTPEGDTLENKGLLLAIADGVSGNRGGREAAEYAVRGLLSDYYATPDTWEIPYALDKVLGAVNRWILAQGVTHRDLQGMASTLSLLVLRGDRYVLGHIGDTRVYRLRRHNLQQLSSDHVWDRPDMRHVLKRAIGLDRHLVVDYADGELALGDVFLLVSDGVWETLGEQAMHELLELHQDPQRAANAMTQQALAQGSQDNVTAVVARVTQVGDSNRHTLLDDGRELAVPMRLKPGQQIDDFDVLDILHESRCSILYKVRQTATQQVLVLKTLQPALRDDEQSRAGLLTEEWLGKKLLSHYFPQVLPLSAERRNFLYYVMTFHEGATLQQHLDRGRHFSVAEAVQIGIRLAKGLAALHRLNIIHRDIKPANLHLGEDGKLRILDLGVALNPATMHGEGNPGTPSFIAPEQFGGAQASVQSDLYAAGVSLYYLLTRKYPYGEIEPFQHPRFGNAQPPTRYRPDIPQWLENLLLKAVARDTKQRFETAEELLLAFEHGERQPVLAPLRVPLAESRPLLLWQWVAAISIVLNLLLVYLLVAS